MEKERFFSPSLLDIFLSGLNMKGDELRVLCFGSYNPRYPRSRVIIKGLTKNNVDVIECNDQSKMWLKYLGLFKKYKSDHDVTIVCHPGHLDVPLAKVLTKLSIKPLVFDAFISLYDTNVFDRKLVKEGSIKSKFYFYADKLACILSDLILSDTKEHIKYFYKTFGIEKEKFRRVFIGADDDVFYPRKIQREEDSFVVAFHGSFIPLQGIQYIVKAARLLEDKKDIKFEILGGGQTYPRIIALCKRLNVKNILFKKPVKYEEVPNFVARGDVCLGIFGDTAKARRVISNKVFEILAMQKPLITGDTLAIREGGIINRKHALLVEMAKPKAIANAILELKVDEKLRRSIAKNGYALFRENFTPKVIGATLKKTLEEAIT